MGNIISYLFPGKAPETETLVEDTPEAEEAAPVEPVPVEAVVEDSRQTVQDDSELTAAIEEDLISPAPAKAVPEVIPAAVEVVEPVPVREPTPEPILMEAVPEKKAPIVEAASEAVAEAPASKSLFQMEASPPAEAKKDLVPEVETIGGITDVDKEDGEVDPRFSDDDDVVQEPPVDKFQGGSSLQDELAAFQVQQPTPSKDDDGIEIIETASKPVEDAPAQKEEPAAAEELISLGKEKAKEEPLITLDAKSEEAPPAAKTPDDIEIIAFAEEKTEQIISNIDEELKALENGPMKSAVKEASPEPAVVEEREQSPEAMFAEKDQYPEPIIPEKEPSPEPMQIEKEQTPEPLVMEKSPEPLVTEKEKSPEPIVMEKEISPEPIVMEKEKSPEPIVMEKEKSPEPIVAERDPSPIPEPVSPQTNNKELSPGVILDSLPTEPRDQSPAPVHKMVANGGAAELKSLLETSLSTNGEDLLQQNHTKVADAAVASVVANSDVEVIGSIHEE